MNSELRVGAISDATRRLDSETANHEEFPVLRQVSWAKRKDRDAHKSRSTQGLKQRGLSKAERGGFEPPVTQSATPVFETGPFNRSGTSPNGAVV